MCEFESDTSIAPSMHLRIYRYIISRIKHMTENNLTETTYFIPNENNDIQSNDFDQRIKIAQKYGTFENKSRKKYMKLEEQKTNHRVDMLVVTPIPEPSAPKRFAMDGKSFNEKFSDKKFYKMTKTNDESEYKTGINTDLNSVIDPYYNLYFTDLELFGRFCRNYLKNKSSDEKSGIVLRRVTVPNDCNVQFNVDVYEANKLILDDPFPVQDLSNWNDITFCESVTKQCPELFKYVKVQTYDLCKYTVNAYPNALEFVNEQNQTHEVCELAIRRSIHSFKYIKTKTEESCKLGIDIDPIVLTYLDNPSEELYWYALKAHTAAIQYIPKECQTIQMAEFIMNNDKNFFPYVAYQTPEICTTAVKFNGQFIKHISNPSIELQLLAIDADGLNIQFINNPSEEICVAAIIQNDNAFKHIPVSHRTPKLFRLLNPPNFSQIVDFTEFVSYLKNGKDKFIVTGLISSNTSDSTEKIMRKHLKNKAFLYPDITMLFYITKTTDLGKISFMPRDETMYPKICHIYNIDMLMYEANDLEEYPKDYEHTSTQGPRHNVKKAITDTIDKSFKACHDYYIGDKPIPDIVV